MEFEPKFCVLLFFCIRFKVSGESDVHIDTNNTNIWTVGGYLGGSVG